MDLEFYLQKHIEYLLKLEKSQDLDSIGYYLTSHLKMGGAYWSLSSLQLLKQTLSKTQMDGIMEFIYSCQNQDGGFGGNSQHDSHITSTHYALLVSIVLNRFQEFKDKVGNQIINYIVELFDSENGGFYGDSSQLEQDVRFSYCGVSSLNILNSLHKIDIDKVAQFVIQCQNYDSSFGGIPGMESHGAYVFCSVGIDKLAEWLSERQTLSGGFNGRPEKLPDVCYSWWIYSSLLMIDRQNCVDQLKLQQYILDCQDKQEGGISDKPGNQQDVFHTFFGIAALSLLPFNRTDIIQYIEPTYALPYHILTNHHFTHLTHTLVQLTKGKNL